jgi:ABC-2 type transport system ATP-binding protein
VQSKAISVKGIRKTYPSNRRRESTPALRGIDVDVDQGTIFCILGPNGAGKTTLISILTTLLYPDEGEGTIGGFDLRRQRGRIREAVNVASGNPNFTDTFSVVENLNYYGMLYGMPQALRRSRIDALVEMFALEAFRQTPFNQLSTGLKQRLALAKALINAPRILFLDEPTMSLDPQISGSIRLCLKELNRRDGLTIILTTHQMDEAEFLSDRIAFLKQGRILVEGKADDLKRGLQLGEVIRILYEGPPFRREWFSSLDGILKVEPGDQQITIAVDSHQKRLDPLIRTLTAQPDLRLRGVEILKPDLEDVFLELAKSSH